LILDYGYGSLSVAGSSRSLREEIGKDQLDRMGAMITGKSIPTNDLLPGIYRLVVTLTDPETLTKATSSMAFKLLSSGEGAGTAWDVYADDFAQDDRSGTNEFQRALTYLAQGDQPAAAVRLEQLLKRDPSNEAVRARLVEYYFGQKKFDQVLALYASIPVTAKVDDDTVLRVADSYDKSGNIKGAADFIESALAAKGPSGTLYVSLASYYQRMGNPQKADELDRKGRSLLSSAPAPSS
jgi:Tfp pilus assembly protein PilF